MRNLHKSEVVKSIRAEIRRLGSASKFADQCGISPIIISHMCNNDWELIRDSMWARVANELAYPYISWQIAETENYKNVKNILNQAKQTSLFLLIAAAAGSGKTEGVKGWLASNGDPYHYNVDCRSWSKREFVENLLQTLELEMPKAYASADRLGQCVAAHLLELEDDKPVLILDHVNALKPSALKFITHLYDALEDKVSIVLIGTRSLEQAIKHGVNTCKAGYDEIDSRLGRHYIHLTGTTARDVAKVCTANGLTDKAIHRTIFKQCAILFKTVDRQELELVEDMRLVKRVVKQVKLNGKYTLLGNTAQVISYP